MCLEDIKRLCRDEPREKPTTPRKALNSKIEYSMYVLLLLLLVRFQNVKHYIQLRKTFSPFLSMRCNNISILDRIAGASVTFNTQEEENREEIIRRYADEYHDEGGFIYIMTDDNSSNDSQGRFKVGSTNDPERRLKQAITFNIDIKKMKKASFMLGI